MRTKPFGMEIHALDNLIRRRAENIKSLQYVESVTGTNGWIIGYIADHCDQNIYQKDLEEKFSITRSTASKVIKRMEQKGLIERHSVPHDARLKKLVLTERAKALHEEIIQDVDEIERELLIGFSNEEKVLLFSFINRLKLNIK